MKISVVANDGSPLGVTMKSLHGTDGRFGVGGAEQAILTLCEAWHQRGDDIIFYNDPLEQDASPFPQRPISDFNPDEDRDIVIVFRSPNPRAIQGKGKKIWFSCDQRTVGDFSLFAGSVDEVVTISPFHAFYFEDVYGITNSKVIDLPVRVWEYDPNTEKVPNQILFSSVPDRGINQLAEIWKLVEAKFSDAKLVITSDWRLWDANLPATMTVPYRIKFAQYQSVSYLGAIPRRELVQIQCQSQILAYPCVYPELFCYSVAEASVAGAYPITSDIGALATTNMGLMFKGSPDSGEWQEAFAQRIVDLLSQPSVLVAEQQRVMSEARERFSIETVLAKWDAVFNG